jgi:hypothetical protein
MPKKACFDMSGEYRPLPTRTKAQSWHTQFELVTFLAQAKRLVFRSTLIAIE